MSQTTYIAPVETFTGKISSHNADGRITVSRRKCYGKDAKGRPIYGPGETYVYHRHEGKWSEGATNNRLLFQQVQTLAKQELSDPDRLAYWQTLFERQFKHPQPNQKRYTTLRGFVIAQLHQQLKSQQ
jgi:hypothetical protein